MHFRAKTILGPVQTYPSVFENGHFFLRISVKTFRVHMDRIKIVFVRPHVYSKKILVRWTSHIEHTQATSSCALR